MIPVNDNRPNYRKAITCLTCPHARNIGRNYVVLECQKHDLWAVEVTFICDDHPDLEGKGEEPAPKEPTILEKKQAKSREIFGKKKTVKRRKASKATQKRKRAEKKAESYKNIDKSHE